MLQIGAGDASKFEFLRLRILLRSSGSDHFWSKNGQKWKVTESFKTCSWDVLGARRVLLSDFKTRQWLLNNFRKSCIFAIFEWFSVATRMLQCHRGFHWGVLRTSSCARSTGAPTFLMAIFEFFGKNAADWCWKCFEIRILKVEHGAKHPFWGSKLENRGVIGNRWWKPCFWAFWYV